MSTSNPAVAMLEPPTPSEPEAAVVGVEPDPLPVLEPGVPVAPTVYVLPRLFELPPMDESEDPPLFVLPLLVLGLVAPGPEPPLALPGRLTTSLEMSLKAWVVRADGSGT